MSKSFSRLPDCLWQPLVKWQSPSGALRPQQSFRPFHFQPPTSQLETSLSLSATHITTCSFTFTFSHQPHNLQPHSHFLRPHNLHLTLTCSQPHHNLKPHFHILRPHFHFHWPTSQPATSLSHFETHNLKPRHMRWVALTSHPTTYLTLNYHMVGYLTCEQFIFKGNFFSINFHK